MIIIRSLGLHAEHNHSVLRIVVTFLGRKLFPWPSRVIYSNCICWENGCLRFHNKLFGTSSSDSAAYYLHNYLHCHHSHPILVTILFLQFIILVFIIVTLGDIDSHRPMTSMSVATFAKCVKVHFIHFTVNSIYCFFETDTITDWFKPADEFENFGVIHDEHLDESFLWLSRLTAHVDHILHFTCCSTFLYNPLLSTLMLAEVPRSRRCVGQSLGRCMLTDTNK